jgi:hypothetical protein
VDYFFAIETERKFAQNVDGGQQPGGRMHFSVSDLLASIKMADLASWSTMMHARLCKGWQQ